MWHEARKHEKKIRGMMVDYKRRAERRRDYYERIKQDPAQFLQVHGRPAKIHLDPAVAAAGDSPATMMPWQGNPSNMIDRFDVRAHLDIIPEYKPAPEYPKSSEETLDDRKVCYERYRTLVQNDYLGINEDKFLHQIFLEERFGPVLKPNFSEEEKKKLAEKKAAIAYVYEDSTPNAGTSEMFSKKGLEEDEEDEDEEEEDKDDLSDIDLDVTVDVSELTPDQCAEMNQQSLKYGMVDDDFITYLMQDKEEAEQLRLAREIEEEKAMFSGRKSRRERRAIREKKLAGRRITSPPSYAARESPTYTPMRFSTSKSRSRSKSPPNTGKIMFITSFGDEVSDGESKKSSHKDGKSGSEKEKDKKDSSSSKNDESAIVIGPLLPDQYESKKAKKSSSSHRNRSSSHSSVDSRKSLDRSRQKTAKSYRSRNRSSSSSSRSRSKAKDKSAGKSRSSYRRRSRSKSSEKSHSRSYRRSRSRSRSKHSRRSVSRTRSRDRSRNRRVSSRLSRSRSRSAGRSRYTSRKNRSRSRSGDRSRGRTKSSHRSRSRTKSDASQSYARSSRRSASPKSRSRSKSTCSKTTDSVSKAQSHSRSPSKKKSASPELPPPPVKSYYRHSLSRSSSDISEDDDDDNDDQDRKDDSGSGMNSGFGSSLRGQQLIGKGSTSTKAKLTPQERLKRRMQLALNRQYKADRRARMEKSEKQLQEQMDRAEELREMAIKLRQRERERRHRMRGYERGSDSESGGHHRDRRARDEKSPPHIEDEDFRIPRKSSSDYDSSSSDGEDNSFSHQSHDKPDLRNISSSRMPHRSIPPETRNNPPPSESRGRSTRSPPRPALGRNYRARSPVKNGNSRDSREDDRYGPPPPSSSHYPPHESSTSSYRRDPYSRQSSSRHQGSRPLVDY